MVTITVAARKGGSGKTCITGHLGAAWAKTGIVTLVDLDPQGSLTRWLLGDRATDGRLCDALQSGADGPGLAELAVETSTSSLWIIPSDVGLEACEREMQGAEMGLLDAANAIGSLLGPVIIDTAPSFGLCSTAALLAADWALVPVLAEPAAAEVAPDSVKAVRRAQRHATKLKLLGVVLNRLDRRLRHAEEIEVMLRDAFGRDVPRTTIPTCGELTASMGERRLATPASRGARAIAELWAELAPRMIHEHEEEEDRPPEDHHERLERGPGAEGDEQESEQETR